MRPLARTSLVTALLVCGAIVVAGLASASVRDVPACRGRDVTASFRLVPGSAGAGNVVYALRLQNTSARSCWVSGLAGLRLLGRTGTPLPTRAHTANPGMMTAVRVVVRPGGWATAGGRFSPDVPGPGEGGRRQCEPVAYRVRVTPPPGGGTTVGPVSPPTPVCEHGSIALTGLVAGTKAPQA